MIFDEELMTIDVERLRRRARIRFQLLPDIPSLLAHFARSIADEIKTRNERREPTRLIFPVGPVKQYPLLVEICNRERIGWKNVYAFNMDEFLDWQGRPIPVDHPLSFEGFMRREVFFRLDEKLRPAEDHCFFPHPFRIDEISEKIQAVGGVDCCYGGIGYHGHVAFNEPPISRWHRVPVEAFRQSQTRVVALGDDSIVVQSIHSSGGDSAAIPPMAVTLGMKDILASRKIRLYCAAGERHRAIFRRAVAGEVTTDYPATLVQGHGDAEVLTDLRTAQPIEIGLH
ncbi:MAG: 6-phosphogluconolactonase [Bryobacteraceae bacterium]